MKELASGVDEREVVPEREAKSIGAECTYDEDLTSRDQIARTLLAHAAKVAERLTAQELAAGAVVVKLKYADFTLLTRRVALPSPASDTTSLHEAGVALLDRFPLRGARVRLTGMAAQDLTPRARLPLELFPDAAAAKRREVQAALGRAKGRFGGAAITFASLLEGDTPAEVDPDKVTRRRPPGGPG